MAIECTDPGCSRSFDTVRGMRTHARTHAKRAAEDAARPSFLAALYAQTPPTVTPIVHRVKSVRGVAGATASEVTCGATNFRGATEDPADVTCGPCRAAQEALDAPSEPVAAPEAVAEPSAAPEDAQEGPRDSRRVDRLARLQVKTYRRNTGDPDGELLRRLDVVTELLQEAQRLQDDLVTEARQLALSWGAIGAAVGVTRQAARQRWGVADAGARVVADPAQMTIE